jgi:hypothetical protein
MRREDDAVHAGTLGAAQKRPDIVGILERVEDEDERRLATFRGPSEDVVERRVSPRFDDERDALVAVEAGECRERATLDLDDRDAQVGGVEDELLEGRTAIRDDEQAPRRTPRNECFLDGAATRNEFLIRA